VAVAVLWLLARVRFQDRPAPPSPIPAVLGQLTTRPKLDDLAADIAELRTRLAPWLVAIDAPPTAHEGPPQSPRLVGLRYRDGVALARLPAPSLRGPNVLAADPASGLALLQIPGQGPDAPPASWTTPAAPGPRYLMATDVSVSSANVSLRPAFVGSLERIVTPLWAEAVWALPVDSDLSPGAVLFTANAELVGVVISYEGHPVVVPAATLLAEADRLLSTPRKPPGSTGIEVQALTTPLAEAIGASTGVVVTWVDAVGAGAAPSRLRIGDIIESIDGRPVISLGDWNVRVARLSAGDTVALRGRRQGSAFETALVAAPVDHSASRTLGLTLRLRARTGAEVLRLEAGSAGERAGLVVGDVIHQFDGIQAPTPSQVTRRFNAMSDGGRALVGVTRGDAHIVTVIER
jgi:hypothetical protein